MSILEMISLGAASVLACLAQMYRSQRDDLAAFIVHSGLLELPEE